MICLLFRIDEKSNAQSNHQWLIHTSNSSIREIDMEYFKGIFVNGSAQTR